MNHSLDMPQVVRRTCYRLCYRSSVGRATGRAIGRLSDVQWVVRRTCDESSVGCTPNMPRVITTILVGW